MLHHGNKKTQHRPLKDDSFVTTNQNMMLVLFRTLSFVFPASCVQRLCLRAKKLTTNFSQRGQSYRIFSFLTPDLLWVNSNHSSVLHFILKDNHFVFLWHLFVVASVCFVHAWIIFIDIVDAERWSDAGAGMWSHGKKFLLKRYLDIFSFGLLFCSLDM